VRIFAFALIGMAALATAISLVGPNIDLRVADLFYDPAARSFSAYPWLGLLREHGYVSIVTCIAFLGAAAAARLWPQQRLAASPRAAFFLLSTLVLGPGLAVNVALKDHWHRPRPVQVVQFGGDKAFVNWWNPTGACERNCSFAGGEVSSAAWMTAPALLAPPLWRAAALSAAALFTATIGLSRMSVGAHFFTDVVFGALISVLIVWGMFALLFPLRRDPRQD